jgi:hypothetical protein
MVAIPAQLLLAANIPGPTVPVQLVNGIATPPDPEIDLFDIQQEIIDGFRNQLVTESQLIA